MAAGPTTDRTVSAHYALKPQEEEFCRIYAAFGFANAAESYRRVYFPEIEDEAGAWHAHPDTPAASTVQKRAAKLLDKDVIKTRLAELREAPTDAAFRNLTDALAFGSESDKRASAKLIFEQEAQLETRSAAILFSDIMVDTFGEVVIPLTDQPECPACGYEGEISFPVALAFEKSGAAASGRNADEQLTALEKTVRSLEARLHAQDEELAELKGEVVREDV